MKTERQRTIARLLRAGAVPSQSELARLLRARGESVTQATVSRDLDELGAFKARLDDGSVAYRLPDEGPGRDGAARLRRMLGEFALDIGSSANLVVVRTPPGGAQPVARALDTAGLDGVLGTVAGDDTILVVCRQGAGGARIAAALRRLAGESAEPRRSRSKSRGS